MVSYEYSGQKAKDVLDAQDDDLRGRTVVQYLNDAPGLVDEEAEPRHPKHDGPNEPAVVSLQLAQRCFVTGFPKLRIDMFPGVRETS